MQRAHLRFPGTERESPKATTKREGKSTSISFPMKSTQRTRPHHGPRRRRGLLVARPRDTWTRPDGDGPGPHGATSPATPNRRATRTPPGPSRKKTDAGIKKECQQRRPRRGRSESRRVAAATPQAAAAQNIRRLLERARQRPVSVIFIFFFFFANKGNHSSSFAVLGAAVERFFGFGPHISVISKHVVATCSREQNRGSQSPRRAWTSKSASRRRRRPPETRVLRRSIHGSQCVDRSASRSLERHCWSLCGRSIGACILLPRGTPSGRVGRLPPVSSFGHVCRT